MTTCNIKLRHVTYDVSIDEGGKVAWVRYANGGKTVPGWQRNRDIYQAAYDKQSNPQK